MHEKTSLREGLVWQVEAGIDECIGDVPIDRFAKTAVKLAERLENQPAQLPERSVATTFSRSRLPEEISSRPMPAPPRNQNSALERAIRAAINAAQAANSIEELKAAVEHFDECALKKTAMNIVFSDGNPEAKIMFIGEAPGAEEDREGRPFVGPSGQFLDRMLASIDLNRSNCYITNVIFWRPPGNRNPTAGEFATCLPFVERHIELIDPDIIVLVGGPASKALLGMKEGITKIRGQWFEYTTKNMVSPVQVTPLYHPAYLMRSPGYKRDAWHDLIKIKQKMLSALVE